VTLVVIVAFVAVVVVVVVAVVVVVVVVVVCGGHCTSTRTCDIVANSNLREKRWKETKNK